jgi:hypothetical protein
VCQGTLKSVTGSVAAYVDSSVQSVTGSVAAYVDSSVPELH